MILDPILDMFRGKAVTIPPLDGAFRPNTRLDGAPAARAQADKGSRGPGVFAPRLDRRAHPNYPFEGAAEKQVGKPPESVGKPAGNRRIARCGAPPYGLLFYWPQHLFFGA